MPLRAEAHVVAVTAAYRRPRELARLLASLATEIPSLAGVIVVDNGGDLAGVIEQAKAGLPVQRLTPARNLGCGGGVACGLRQAFSDPAVTHAWILDDDAAATPGALAAMLAALTQASAEAAVPLVTDEAGSIGWFPGPLAQPAWDAIRRPGISPAQFRAAGGTAPLRWNWAPWTSLLVTRRAVETVGLPREDYWFQGEDLEWTLRISAQFTGVLAPAAECRHFVPARGDAGREFLKHVLMLQNNSYTASRLPHGRRARRHLPGNAWRCWRAGGFAPRALGLVGLALWRGAVRGGPAGRPGTDGFRGEWERRP